MWALDTWSSSVIHQIFLELSAKYDSNATFTALICRLFGITCQDVYARLVKQIKTWQISSSCQYAGEKCSYEVRDISANFYIVESEKKNELQVKISYKQHQTRQNLHFQPFTQMRIRLFDARMWMWTCLMCNEGDRGIFSQMQSETFPPDAAKSCTPDLSGESIWFWIWQQVQLPLCAGEEEIMTKNTVKYTCNNIKYIFIREVIMVNQHFTIINTFNCEHPHYSVSYIIMGCLCNSCKS